MCKEMMSFSIYVPLTYPRRTVVEAGAGGHMWWGTNRPHVHFLPNRIPT